MQSWRLTAALALTLIFATAGSSQLTLADESPSTVDKSAAAASKIWHPGEALSINTDTEDVVATYDIDLAKRQVAAYPDSPEASFILAVALTRTSRVEEALKEVRRARRLAESKGDPSYFDKMISSYERMLKSYPDENQVRYTLAWAYYMKAYLLARYSRNHASSAAKVINTAAGANTPAACDKTAATTAAAPPETTPPNTVASGTKGTDLTGLIPASVSPIPFLPSMLDNVAAADAPRIKQCYQSAISRLDELIGKQPKDIWALVYRAHLKAEYTGNLEEAMSTWTSVQKQYPNNPAPYFFLGEGYLKQGNLRESINNVSRAISLRALGN